MTSIAERRPHRSVRTDHNPNNLPVSTPDTVVQGEFTAAKVVYKQAAAAQRPAAIVVSSRSGVASGARSSSPRPQVALKSPEPPADKPAAADGDAETKHEVLVETVSCCIPLLCFASIIASAFLGFI